MSSRKLTAKPAGKQAWIPAGHDLSPCDVEELAHKSNLLEIALLGLPLRYEDQPMGSDATVPLLHIVYDLQRLLKKSTAATEPVAAGRNR